MTCHDFRGIAVSPIISKVFEYCILEKFNKFITSCDVRFGFKKVSVVEMQFIVYAKLLIELLKEVVLLTFVLLT